MTEVCSVCHQPISEDEDTHPLAGGLVHAEHCPCWDFPEAHRIAPRQPQTDETIVGDQGRLL